MKKLSLPSLGLFSVIFLFAACTADDLSDVQRSSAADNGRQIILGPGESDDSGMTSRIVSTTACNAYEIALESITLIGGNYEWVWSVTNLNPGNGNGGTVQNLSHWGMQFGSCFTWSSVVGAAYSGDGVNWTNFTPTYGIDPSQGCMTTPLFKFDFGTVGGAPSYYKLVLNENYAYGSAPGYFKSGTRTGCCTFNFVGVGCQLPPEER